MAYSLAASYTAGGAALGDIIAATLGATVLTLALLTAGLLHRQGRFRGLTRLAAFSERVSGLPGWAALPSAVSTVSLLVALTGMYWDISFHIDKGRDPGPFANPAHFLILFGLFGIFSAGFLAMALPEGRPSRVAVRLREDWYAPLGGLLIAACGAFSLIGFPLDDVWHRMFGQDVTLWGPTHLMLIGGAAMTLVGQAVLLVEGMRARPAGARMDPTWVVRLRRTGITGGLLIGLSTFQGEFDFGVPQFQFLFHPVLIAVAAAVALVCARIWIGRGAAFGAVGFFLLMRGFVTFFVAVLAGKSTPHFPLYIAEACIVEALAWNLRRPTRPLAFGALAGFGIGTLGFLAEWGWSHVWMPLPWNGGLLPDGLVCAAIVGVAGGVIGALMGSALSGTVPARAQVRLALPVATLAIMGVVGYGLATTTIHGAGAQVSVRTLQAGPERTAQATFHLRPASLGDGAGWLTLTAWQGGGLVVDRLHRVREGVYTTTKPIPVYGQWKAMLRLERDRALMSMPLYLPTDKAIPVKGVPARAAFTRPFVLDKHVLQRERKQNTPAWLTTAAPLVVLVIALGLLTLLGWGLARIAATAGEDTDPPSPERAERERSRSAIGPATPVGA